MNNTPLVSTIQEKCRVCYTCVRECPAKAIRISGGQAEVIADRCIGCGNCVKVCSQKAKLVRPSTDAVKALLASGCKTAAILAPSFPAEFENIDYRRFVGMVRALGFDIVAEVAFGADLVAEKYRRLIGENKNEHFIAVNCPALIAYVQKYHPDLVESLAPIVSPMIATSRALKILYGKDLRIVFIGPCIGKKAEAVQSQVAGEVDEVLTFSELRLLFEIDGIDPATVVFGDFDPPHAGLGTLFPISRGMLQAAQLDEDLVESEIVAADGRTNFMEAIKEFEEGALDARLLEVLCCNGCIMGPGMTTTEPLFHRRSVISQYVRQRLQQCPDLDQDQQFASLAELDLSREFQADDKRVPVPNDDELNRVMLKMGKATAEDELNCGACGYDTCREHAIAIVKGLAESEMCLPYAIERLKKMLQELAASHEQLATAQQALLQSKRLASMGQLAAGIAHELNNPLGIVLLYSHALLDECDTTSENYSDLQMIVEQSDRCKKIVSGLLNFARKNRLVLKKVNLPQLLDRCIVSMLIPPTIMVESNHEQPDLTLELDPDQLTQVLVNLLTNAAEAMPGGGRIKVSSRSAGDNALIEIADNGPGIPADNMSKIFEPFFTTKQIGKGTGLGLAVSYGIIKMHRGEISVKSNANSQNGPTGTVFTLSLPLQRNPE